MDSLSQIALTMTPGLGPTSVRKLVDLYPDTDIFSLPAKELDETFGTHHDIAASIVGKTAFPRAEQELAFCEKNHIRPLFFTDNAFPQRLNRPETSDCPALLYVMGSADLNPERPVAVVGTRKATQQGRDNTERIIGELKAYNTPIVSGLAYGIDTAAHTAALKFSLPTVAVLGHGLDQIYPTQNRTLAKNILEHGGALVTEYPSGTGINPRFFPARNRIIAALSDATVVVEASEKGGALITAALAGGYQREVFALPGRLSDTYSRGTNNLIATNKALLARNADDIAFHLGWPLAQQQLSLESQLGIEAVKLSAQEKHVVDTLRTRDSLSLDEIASLVNLSLPQTAALLFNLELKDLLRTLPGHLYCLR